MWGVSRDFAEVRGRRKEYVRTVKKNTGEFIKSKKEAVLKNMFEQ